MSISMMPRVEAARIGQIGDLGRSLWRQLALALGRGGLLLASIAAAVGLLSCIASFVTMRLSLHSADVHLGQHAETKVLAFNKSNYLLNRTITSMSLGGQVPATGERPAWNAWHAYESALRTMCTALDPAVPGIDHLRQACDPGNPSHDRLAAEIAAFDPPRHPLSQAAWRELQEQRDEVTALTEFTILRTDVIEDELVRDYNQAMVVLALGSVGFGGSGLVLLLLVGRASMRHFASWEEAARERARLQSIIESSGATIVLTDRDLNIVAANREFWKTRGLDPALSIGRPLSELVETKLNPAILAQWQRGVLTTEESKPVQYISPYVDADGRSRILNITAKPVVDDDHIVRQIVFVGVDDTERSEAEQALFAADRMSTLGEMAATMVHELRQPLSIMQLAGDAALEELSGADPVVPPDAAYIRQKLEKIAAQVQRADGIIEDLRVYARGTGGDVARPFDPALAIAGAVDMTSAGCSKARVAVSQSVTEQLPPLVGHANKLEQVLINLINNARDAGGHAVVVSAVLQSTEGQQVVRIAVEDDGPGIPDNVLPRLFHSFVTTKCAGKGTGLGLRICRRIIEEMGGSITAGNRPKGGAKFEIALPVDAIRPLASVRPVVPEEGQKPPIRTE